MRMDAEDDAATLVEESIQDAESNKGQPKRPDSQGTDSNEAAAAASTAESQGSEQ
jgi:hypothetical protein